MTEQPSDLERELADLKEENELLLLQLHQVQEELESYYLRNLSWKTEAVTAVAERNTICTRENRARTTSAGVIADTNRFVIHPPGA